MHQTISIRGILLQTSKLRNGTECTFAFESDVRPVSGSQSIIMVVGYSDKMKYAFRLPYHFRQSKIRDLVLATELEHWKAFVQSSIPFVQRLAGYSLSTDGPIGFPPIAYEWVEGKPLLWNDQTPHNPVQREKIIRSLASSPLKQLVDCKSQVNSISQLIVLSQADGKGIGEATAEVYVTRAIDRKIKRVLSGQLALRSS